MLLEEALVIFACLNSSGCSETSNQYFALHPEVKRTIEKKGQDVRRMIGPQIVDSTGPMVFFIAGGTGVIHLTRRLNLQMNKQSGMIIFSKDY